MGEVYDLVGGKHESVLECVENFAALVLADVNSIEGLICIVVDSDGVVQAHHAGLNAFELLGVVDYASDILCSGAAFLYEEENE